MGMEFIDIRLELAKMRGQGTRQFVPSFFHLNSPFTGHLNEEDRI